MFPIRDHEPSGRFPLITIGIIALNIWVFWQELTAPSTELFIRQWALVPALVNFSDPLSLIPFVTSQFLHAGFAHIIFNMWYLWIFGDNIEARMGHGQFLLFYLTAGLTAGLVQFFFLADSVIPMLGASGAVAGVLGAYLRLFPHHRIDTIWPDLFLLLGFSSITIPAGVVLFFWFFTQLFNGTASILISDTAATGGVAWWAHIGGFAFGWLVAGLYRRRQAQNSFSFPK